MKFDALKLSACAAALMATMLFIASAEASTSLDAENVTDYCVETYGEGATAETPSFNSVDGPKAQCSVEEGGEVVSFDQSVDEICEHVTGYAPWDVVFGRIDCLGENAFGRGDNNGGGSFTYN